MTAMMHKRVGWLTFILCTVGTVALLLLRAQAVIHFDAPQHVVTSGYEEESLFALWKYVQGLPVYQSPHEIPFSASYFNWFFYACYGSVIAMVLSLWQISVEWIPTIGRCMTLFIVCVGCWLQYHLLRISKSPTPLASYIALALSAFLWCGPLMGYWALTVRPDALSLFLDVCAGYFILRIFTRHGVIERLAWFRIIIAALLCFLSWSCKQINIVMFLAIMLLFCWERQWRYLLAFCIIFFGGVFLTLIFANPEMVKMLFFMDTTVSLSFHTLIINLIHFGKKTLPVILLALMVGYLWLRHGQIRTTLMKDASLRLALCGVLVWGGILFPASSKIGSAENYYFELLFFLTLGIGACIRYFQVEKSFVFPIGCQIAGIAWMILLAFAGTSQSIKQIELQQSQSLALKHCLQQLSPPIFVFDHYGALPWMNPSQISFVLAYNYWSDRADEKAFEQEGIGGLIEQHYFRSLIIPQQMKSFDQASLVSYEKTKECAGYDVYVQRLSKQLKYS